MAIAINISINEKLKNTIVRETSTKNIEEPFIDELLKITNNMLSRNDIIDILNSIYTKIDTEITEKEIIYIITQIIKDNREYIIKIIDHQEYYHIGSYLYRKGEIEKYLNIIKEFDQELLRIPINLNLLDDDVVLFNLSNINDNMMFETFIKNKIIIDPITIDTIKIELPSISGTNNDSISDIDSKNK